MERYRIGLPKEENIIIRNKFVADNIDLICIRSLEKHEYSILFGIEQNCTEEKIFVQMILKASTTSDLNFLNDHPLNINNIQNNPESLEIYQKATEELDIDRVYFCDFDMVEFEKKIYYLSIAGILLDDKGHYGLLDLLITRDNYIKLNLFFNKLMKLTTGAEYIFSSKKLKNIEFVTIDHVKLDASAGDSSSNIILNHYTCGRGPTIFKFNYISPRFPDRQLKNPLLPEMFNTFYGEAFVISDMIYDYNQDHLIVLYEDRSEVTYRYKSTKALVFTKALYNKTNLINHSNNYYKETNKDEETIN